MSNHVRMSGFVELRDANGYGELLYRMNRKLSHHGPDAEGYYEQGPHARGRAEIAYRMRSISCNSLDLECI